MTRTTSVNDIIANRSIGSGKTSQIQRKGGPVRSITRKAGGMKFTQSDLPDLALRKSPKNIQNNLKLPQ